MASKSLYVICAALASLGWPVAACAQAAAETAVILSGTGQATGRASRSLGSAISGSINGAAAQIQATRQAAPATYQRRRRARGGDATAYAIPSNVDTLEGTDAPTYTLGNGASIRVSGRLVQGAETSCAKNCAQDAAGSNANH